MGNKISFHGELDYRSVEGSMPGMCKALGFVFCISASHIATWGGGGRWIFTMVSADSIIILGLLSKYILKKKI